MKTGAAYVVCKKRSYCGGLCSNDKKRGEKVAYQLIAFDLDGTLTQHKSKLEDFNRELLCDLQKKYRCLMVGAGGCERIYKQLGEFPIDIIGNYGMQQSKIENGKFVLVKNDSYTVDRKFFDETAAELREITGYTQYAGESVEYHASGAVTFPLLGTAAKLEDKLHFDPGGAKRRAIYPLVAKAFGDYNCFVGGSSSFDIVKKQYDKYRALMAYAAEEGIKKEEILFVGDDFETGGNDEQVKLGGIDCVFVKDYRQTRRYLQEKNVI